MPVKDSDLYDENNDSCTPKKYNNASNDSRVYILLSYSHLHI